MMIKSAIICVLFAVSVIGAINLRNKRAAYELPDGVESYIGEIDRSGFECSSPGYYADMRNDCKLFHVCVNYEFPDGKKELAQFTFACGNQTVFNQFSMTCANEQDAIPCESSPDFYYLNEMIGKEKEPLHTQADYDKAQGYFGARNSKN